MGPFWYRLRTSPPVTVTIIAICALVWIIQLTAGTGFTLKFAFAPVYIFPELMEPWRIFTSMFLHSTFAPFHILLNMFFLWQIGTDIERVIGSGRFLTIYLISGLGAAAAIVYLQRFNSLTLGASGGIFGLFGALIVFRRQLRLEANALWITLGLNLVISFMLPGISWQAHLGGLLAGAAAASAIKPYKRKDNSAWMLLALALVLLAAIFARPYVLPLVIR